MRRVPELADEVAVAACLDPDEVPLRIPSRVTLAGGTRGEEVAEVERGDPLGLRTAHGGRVLVVGPCAPALLDCLRGCLNGRHCRQTARADRAQRDHDRDCPTDLEPPVSLHVLLPSPVD